MLQTIEFPKLIDHVKDLGMLLPGEAPVGHVGQLRFEADKELRGLLGAKRRPSPLA
jgi:hypothetical protein